MFPSQQLFAPTSFGVPGFGSQGQSSNQAPVQQPPKAMDRTVNNFVCWMTGFKGQSDQFHNSFRMNMANARENLSRLNMKLGEFGRLSTQGFEHFADLLNKEEERLMMCGRETSKLNEDSKVVTDEIQQVINAAEHALRQRRAEVDFMRKGFDDNHRALSECVTRQQETLAEVFQETKSVITTCESLRMTVGEKFQEIEASIEKAKQIISENKKDNVVNSKQMAERVNYFKTAISNVANDLAEFRDRTSFVQSQLESTLSRIDMGGNQSSNLGSSGLPYRLPQTINTDSAAGRQASNNNNNNSNNIGSLSQSLQTHNEQQMNALLSNRAGSLTNRSLADSLRHAGQGAPENTSGPLMPPSALMFASGQRTTL